MNRGEVRWHTFKPPDKRRPVVTVTRQGALPYLTAVVVAPITSTVRDIPSEVYLDQADGLHAPCAANCDNLQTVRVNDLSPPWAMLLPERLADLDRALRFALGCECPGE